MTASTLTRTAAAEPENSVYIDAYSFVDYSLDEQEDEETSDEYSWNTYTQTSEEDDWDQQDGTWGIYGSYGDGDGSSDTYVDLDDYEANQWY